MKPIIFLSCLVLLLIGSCFCSVEQTKIATIQLKVNSFSDSIPLCTGLVLSPNLILTRANCLVILSQQFGFNPLLKQSAIVPPMIHSSLLSVQLDKNTQKKVYHVELHDHFNLFTLESNLALLMLSTNGEETNESTQQVLHRELQTVMQEFEKNKQEEMDSNLVLLSNMEQLSSSDCLKETNQWRKTICKQITYSGESNSLEDSFLFHESNQQTLIPIGIQSYHESNQHEHKLFYTIIGKETLDWLSKVDKQLQLRETKTIPFETYDFSPIDDEEDLRPQIMLEIQKRLAEIINPGPNPQTDNPPTTRSAPLNTIYETENNLKEISKELHSKLINSVLGLK